MNPKDFGTWASKYMNEFETYFDKYIDDDVKYCHDKMIEILDEPEEIELIPRKFTKLNIRRD